MSIEFETLIDRSIDRNNVLLAMSGGVDSSVSALILNQLGFNVVGVSMQVWDYRRNGGSCSKATCCSPKDFMDARKVAGKLGIPYYVFDFEESFEEKVISPFVSAYASGETPNPCVECNNFVKFKELMLRGRDIGYPVIATGHYARISKRDNCYVLLRGVDREKDQSYFLSGLSQEELRNIIFPVGNLTKKQVRDLARKHGLCIADKAESQDVCFISGTVKHFLQSRGVGTRKGPIFDHMGKRVGTHDGIQFFTIGQRRGINVGGYAEPMYVIDIDTERNAITIGPRTMLKRDVFYIRNFNFVSPKIDFKERIDAVAQLRHRHKGVRVQVEVKDNGLLKARFVDEWGVVVPGQVCTLYDLDNERVIGGGKIGRFPIAVG